MREVAYRNHGLQVRGEEPLEAVQMGTPCCASSSDVSAAAGGPAPAWPDDFNVNDRHAILLGCNRGSRDTTNALRYIPIQS